MKRTQRISTVLALGLLTIALSACAGKGVKPDSPSAVVTGGSSRAEIVPMIGTLKVHRYNLDNGLRLLIVEDHSSPTFAYQTWFRVGSRDEEFGRTGLAHLFEHMMFKTTKNIKDGEYSKILEAAGAKGINAFTSRDYTAYIQELPSDKLDLIARMESDRMVNLIIDEKAFKTETEVVQNERRYRNENSPDGLMYQTIFELAYNKHSYRWPVIGYQEDLNRMTAEDAVKFYRSYYSPNHATIVVAGDVNPDEVLKTITKYYAHIPGQASPVNVIPEEPEQSAPKRKLMKFSIQSEKLLMGYHIPSVLHDDIPALQVLQGVLAGGKSSRLHRALVETGIATSVGAYSLDDKDPSLYMIGIELQKGKKAAQAEAIVLKEIQRMLKEQVSDKELERAKNRLNFEFYQGFGSNSRRANFLGHYEAIAKGFEAGLAIQNKLQAVTALDLQAVVKRYLYTNNRTVIVGTPK